MLQKIIIFTLSLVLFTAVAAQDPPAAAPSSVSNTADSKKSKSIWGSVNNLPATPPFVSTEGRFSIGLKSQIDGYSAITPQQLGIKANGSQLTWKFDEGEIRAIFLEFDKALISGSENNLQQLTKNGKELILFTYPQAKIRDEAYFRFNALFPASRIIFDLPNNLTVVQKICLVENRMYKFFAIFQKGESENFISAALDSFKIISQDDINADIRKKFEAVRPSPLPQQPVVKKLRSDAEDEGLKKKVKQIILESEDLSGTWSIQGRRVLYETNYNQDGNRVDSILYGSKSVPTGATVWGYINGKRVFKTETIRDETGPPPMAMPKSKLNETTPQPDLRYQYSYEYKYIDGRLTEKQLFDNTGKKGMLYAYKRAGNQVEEFVYTDDGKLNQHYLKILDNEGNEIEETNFDLSKAQYYGDRKYRYEYEFDKQGNWIKKITYKEEAENGVKLFKPYSVYYRTISYY